MRIRRQAATADLLPEAVELLLGQATLEVRARVPRGSPDRGAARRLPAGGQPWRPVVVSASVADAGFLGVLDRVIGDRRDHLDLPGAVHEIPAGAGDRGDRRAQGV